MADRIQKRLAQLGLGSRREIETWIQQGRIKVNGTIATLGQTIEDGDKVLVDGKNISLEGDKTPSKHLIMYNKPEGEVCTRSDPQGRPTVFKHLPAVHNGRWISVGRLDVNTSGLLLFTSDGELANRLMHPSYQIDREYAVRVMGDVTDDMLTTLVNGVELEDGPARFEEIVIADHERERESQNQWYYVCLQEGRNREVRRIWESLDGIKVSRLKRVRYANIFLEKRLKPGQWMLVEEEDLKALYQLVDLKAPVIQRAREEGGERKDKFNRTRSNAKGQQRRNQQQRTQQRNSQRRRSAQQRLKGR